MAQGGKDLYGDFGSVPSQTDTSGSGATPLSVRANANEFGAQIGQATEKVGNTMSEIGNQFNGIIMETAANQAELGYIKASGDLKAKYSQYEGLQAEAMRPQYEQDLQNSREQYRQNLPLLAQKAFDANTIRTVGHLTSEYSSYAASQVKGANLKSHSALMDMAVSKTGDLGIVLDPKAFGEQVLAPIVAGGNAVADIHGDTILANGINEETGNYKYNDTPEGKASEARHLSVTNGKLAEAYLTAVKTISDNQGPIKAAKWAEEHRNMMPDEAKVRMNQYLAPKIKNEQISTLVNSESNNLTQGYADRTPLDIIRKNEGVGYSRDNKGEVINGINSIAFPKEFSEAKNILDTQGQAAATRYADDFYQKNIIDKYNIGSLPKDTQAIVADGLVNHGAGEFGQSLLAAAKNGASPEQLINMRRIEYKRLNDTGKPEYTKSFSGWNKRLDELSPDGMKESIIDYYKNNSETAASSVYDKSMQEYGDPIMADRARTNFLTKINSIVRQANGQLDTAQNVIIKTINGDYSNGRKPSSLQEISFSSPEARNALEQIQEGRPAQIRPIEKMLLAISKGESAKGYGDLLPIMNRIASDDDTDSIKDIATLSQAYGEKTDLFVNGFKKASELLESSKTPEGKSVITKQSQFLNDLRNRMVASDTDTAHIKKFNDSLPAFFRTYNEYVKAGKDTSSLLSFNDKNEFVKGLNLPPRQDLTARKITGVMETIKVLWSITKGPGRPEVKILHDYKHHLISEEEKYNRLNKMGIITDTARSRSRISQPE